MLPAIAETGLKTVFSEAEEIFTAFFLYLKDEENLTSNYLIFVTAHNKMSISLNYVLDFSLHREFPFKISFISLHHFALRAKAVNKIQKCMQL